MPIDMKAAIRQLFLQHPELPTITLKRAGATLFTARAIPQTQKTEALTAGVELRDVVYSIHEDDVGAVRPQKGDVLVHEGREMGVVEAVKSVARWRVRAMGR